MGRVCMGRLGNGPSLQWAEFAMGRDVQLPMRGESTNYVISLWVHKSFGTQFEW